MRSVGPGLSACDCISGWEGSGDGIRCKCETGEMYVELAWCRIQIGRRKEDACLVRRVDGMVRYRPEVSRPEAWVVDWEELMIVTVVLDVTD